MKFFIFCCYLVGSIGYFIFAYRGKAVAYKGSSFFIVVGLIAHCMDLIFEFLSNGSAFFVSKGNSLSIVAFLSALLFIILASFTKLRIMGTIVMPLISAMMFTSLLLPSTTAQSSKILKNSLITFHIATIFVAYSFFTIAFSLSVIYLLQERILKKKALKTAIGKDFNTFPSLESLDRLSHRCIMIGFPLMTAGLISGFGSASLFWKSAWSGDPKEIFSLITWTIYAILFHERLAVGWRGKKASWLAILGFIGVLITFIGIHFIFRSHHHSTVFFK